MCLAAKSTTLHSTQSSLPSLEKQSTRKGNTLFLVLYLCKEERGPGAQRLVSKASQVHHFQIALRKHFQRLQTDAMLHLPFLTNCLQNVEESLKLKKVSLSRVAKVAQTCLSRLSEIPVHDL